MPITDKFRSALVRKGMDPKATDEVAEEFAIRGLASGRITSDDLEPDRKKQLAAYRRCLARMLVKAEACGDAEGAQRIRDMEAGAEETIGEKDILRIACKLILNSRPVTG